MTDINLWNQLFVWPILNLLVALYKGFEALRFPSPLVFAIVSLTILMRILLYPLMAAQLKSARRMALLKPKLDDLSHKHKDDKKALQQAQLDLYKEHGINPAGGCLPLLVQFPILIALYGVFNHVLASSSIETVVADINKIVYLPAFKIESLDLSFFGTSLATKPSEWQTLGIWLLAVPVITGLLQWWQSKLMLPSVAKSVDSKPGQSLAKKDTKKAEGEKKEDTAMEMQKQMALITPIMFGYFAFQFPLGLALYWNVFGLFGIIQQIRVNNQHPA